MSDATDQMTTAEAAAFERWLASATERAMRGEDPHNREHELFSAGYRAAVADLEAQEIS